MATAWADSVMGVLADFKSESSLVFLALCTVLSFFLTALICQRIAYNRKYNWPPGPRGWPLIGVSPLIGPNSGQTNTNITRLGKQFGPDLFTLNLYAGKRMLILNSFKAIKEAFVRQSTLFSDRPSVWPFTYVNKNRRNVGVFLEPFTESWKREKKFLIRTVRQFGYGTSKSEEKVVEQANCLVDLIKKRNGQPFDLGPLTSLCMLNVTFSIIFSATYDEEDEKFSMIHKAIMAWYVEIFKLYHVEPLLPFFDKFGLSPRLKRGQQMTQDICAFVQDHIDHHRATLDPNNSRDMVDECLIELAKNDPNGELRDFTDEKFLWMMFFFIPDQGDTAVGLFQFLVLANAIHSEVQQRVYEEIQEVIGDRPPSLDDKDRMPYTEAVIMETLRMDTTFWLLVPHFTAGDVNIFGYNIPKDTTVIPNIYAVHFDPELWGDPENFRPERFIDDCGKTCRPEYYMPFSTGRRSCIGEQMAQKQFFIFYVTLLQNYILKLPDGDPIPKLESQWLWVSPPEFRLQAELRK